MERIANKARGFDEAFEYEIEQYRNMTPDERRAVAKALRDRVYGTNCPDVRDAVAGMRRKKKADVTGELSEDTTARWGFLMTAPDEPMRTLAQRAYAEPVLRQLSPYRSLNNLCFARNTEHPHDALPYILATDDRGHYEVRGPTHAFLGEGNLEQVMEVLVGAIVELLATLSLCIVARWESAPHIQLALDPEPKRITVSELHDADRGLHGLRVFKYDLVFTELPSSLDEMLMRCLGAARAAGAEVAWFAFDTNVFVDQLLTGSTSALTYAISDSEGVSIASREMRGMDAWWHRVARAGKRARGVAD